MRLRSASVCQLYSNSGRKRTRHVVVLDESSGDEGLGCEAAGEDQPLEGGGARYLVGKTTSQGDHGDGV